jgi:hypothetical protein
MLCTRGEQEVQEQKELCSGIFWVISDDYNLDVYKLLIFEIPCDASGNNLGIHNVELNSKSGSTYNHKKIWESEIKNNSAHKPYNKKDYDHYPRGRVEIANNRATIYLNPNINTDTIVDDIKRSFGLSESNIADIRVISDNSTHYQCWTDREDY